jgi:HlyD family secretion protein
MQGLPRKSRKGLWIVLVLAVVGLAAVFVVRNRRPKAIEFVTSPVERGPLRNVVNSTGVVQTVVTVQVGSQVSGQVQELFADFNSVVKRGQLLAKLDPRNSEAQVQNSRANVTAAQARVRSAEADVRTNTANIASAKANLEGARVARENADTLFQRSVELSQKGIVSKNDYDNAKANADSARAKYDQAVAAVDQVQAQGGASTAQLEQAKAQAEQAQADLDRALLNLEYSNIYSPVDGVVILRNVDVGQTIAASMQTPTLFTIANDLTRMQVNASVDEADIGSISAANDVKFTVDAYPNDTFEAKIAEIRLSPQTVQNVVTYSVILSFENSQLKLRPGMTANITFTVDERKDVVRIANAALRYSPPGQQPESSAAAGTVPQAVSGAPGAAARQMPEAQGAATHLAPGQSWNPSDKMRFMAPARHMDRSGLVWVLNATGQPESRKVVLGITDGVSTEMVSGDVKVGDSVITGDNAPAPAATTSTGTTAPASASSGGQRGQ